MIDSINLDLSKMFVFVMEAIIHYITGYCTKKEPGHIGPTQILEKVVLVTYKCHYTAEFIPNIFRLFSEKKHPNGECLARVPTKE